MSGVTSLGHVTTHSGETGLGFAAPSGLGQITLVLSPSSGKLLEAGNVEDQVLEGAEGPGQAFANMADPHGFAFKGGGEKSIVRWLDPIASPTVVNSIPSSLRTNSARTRMQRDISEPRRTQREFRKTNSFR